MSRFLEYLEPLRQFVQRSPIVFWSTLGLLALTVLLFVFLPVRRSDNAATSHETPVQGRQPGDRSKGSGGIITPAQTKPLDADRSAGEQGTTVLLQSSPSGRSAPADRNPRPAGKSSSQKSGGSKSDGRFTVQVASFASEDAARQMSSKLNASGYPAFVRTAQIPGKGRTYRVRVGAFATREEAQRYGDKLKAQEDTVTAVFATIND
jgi:cell division septation protein DedD